MVKQILNSHERYQYIDDNGQLRAYYVPEIPIDEWIPGFDEKLANIPYVRVKYISRFGKQNRTPRKTWAYGHVNSDVVTYSKRGQTLKFSTEPMPQFLRELANYCCEISKINFGFDPGYNSCIIGRYDGRDDSIGFHFDTESFLVHHFCANVTVGYARDFQFRDEHKKVHEIALQNHSLFFFNGLEHALPKRASVKPGEVRYSISFRNMKQDLGIANTFYYCRGLAGAIDDEDKQKYAQTLKTL